MANLKSHPASFHVLGRDRTIGLLRDETGKIFVRYAGKIVEARVEWRGKTAVLLRLGEELHRLAVEKTPEGLRLIHQGDLCWIKKPFQRASHLFADSSHKSTILVKNQMPGLIVAVHVRENQPIKEGETVLVIEAMKMQNPVKAPVSGKVRKLFVSAGMSVESGISLIEIEKIVRVKP